MVLFGFIVVRAAPAAAVSLIGDNLNFREIGLVLQYEFDLDSIDKLHCMEVPEASLSSSLSGQIITEEEV